MRQRKIVRLVQVRSERKANQAKQMRASMFECCRNAARARGDELSGFALVTWGRSGLMRTAINEGYGPYDWANIPTHAAKALEGHITMRAIDAHTEIDNGDDDHAS